MFDFYFICFSLPPWRDLNWRDLKLRKGSTCGYKDTVYSRGNPPQQKKQVAAKSVFY